MKLIVSADKRCTVNAEHVRHIRIEKIYSRVEQVSSGGANYYILADKIVLSAHKERADAIKGLENLTNALVSNEDNLLYQMDDTGCKPLEV